ncbi:hypothetical protein DFH07DRAFT_1060078 [Mycena maculata]|uniref:Uncharacterized protein n=1 Tax=Mycena maculata TaxID=230809 RepID=A0AAD7NHK0_9AGAR|nr:hypothetical protein DFH07DRAFT_1060078 [Mycena maculata]
MKPSSKPLLAVIATAGCRPAQNITQLIYQGSYLPVIAAAQRGLSLFAGELRLEDFNPRALSVSTARHHRHLPDVRSAPHCNAMQPLYARPLLTVIIMARAAMLSLHATRAVLVGFFSAISTLSLTSVPRQHHTIFRILSCNRYTSSSARAVPNIRWPVFAPHIFDPD